MTTENSPSSCIDFEVELSTRPEKYIGDTENWNKAEEVSDVTNKSKAGYLALVFENVGLSVI